MRVRRPELHTLAGAYALDALSGAGRARFARHLARCQACAREQRELREVTARLAAAVAADPPADLVARVIAAAARTRQLPPDTGPARAGRPARRMRRAGSARRDGGRRDEPGRGLVPPEAQPLARRIKNHVAFWNGVRIEAEPQGERPRLLDRLPGWLRGKR